MFRMSSAYSIEKTVLHACFSRYMHNKIWMKIVCIEGVNVESK